MHSIFQILFVACLLITSPARAAESDLLSREQATQLKQIIASRKCPCRCGRYLPGSNDESSCFGCTVGKAEVTRIIQYLASGKKLPEIAVKLDGPILIDVYADYSDPELPEVWELVNAIAGPLDANRIILRPLAAGEFERMAIALVEFARENGKFSETHMALIEHSGPWDASTLVEIARELGLNPEEAVKFMRTVDLDPQINKDRQHARLDRVTLTPAIYVNGNKVDHTAEALRRAIHAVMVDGSM